MADEKRTEEVNVRISYGVEEKERVFDVLRVILKALKEVFPESDAPVTVHVDVSQPKN